MGLNTQGSHVSASRRPSSITYTEFNANWVHGLSPRGGALAVIQSATLQLGGNAFTGNHLVQFDTGAGATYSPDQWLPRGFQFFPFSIMSGGAIYVHSQSPIGYFSAGTRTALTVDSCTFELNSAWDGGAIMLVGLVDLLTERSVFQNNSALEKGALPFSSRTRLPTVSEVASSETHAAAHTGGAIFVNGAASLVDLGCIFRGNTASMAGALYQLGPVSLSNTWLVGNTAKHGGAMFLSNWTDATERCPAFCPLTLFRTDFEANVRAPGPGCPRTPFPASPLLLTCHHRCPLTDSSFSWERLTDASGATPGGYGVRRRVLRLGQRTTGAAQPAPACSRGSGSDGCSFIRNNGSSWGDLIATRPTRFNLSAPLTVYPGGEINVVMRMYDAYGQLVIDVLEEENFGEYYVDEAVPLSSYREGGVIPTGSYVSGSVNLSGNTFACIPGRQYKFIAGARERAREGGRKGPSLPSNASSSPCSYPFPQMCGLTGLCFHR